SACRRCPRQASAPSAPAPSRDPSPLQPPSTRYVCPPSPRLLQRGSVFRSCVRSSRWPPAARACAGSRSGSTRAAFPLHAHALRRDLYNDRIVGTKVDLSSSPARTGSRAPPEDAQVRRGVFRTVHTMSESGDFDLLGKLLLHRRDGCVPGRYAPASAHALLRRCGASVIALFEAEKSILLGVDLTPIVAKVCNLQIVPRAKAQSRLIPA